MNVTNDPNESTCDRVTSLMLLWEEKRAQGQNVTPAELCRDHPDLLNEVARRIEALAAMYAVPNEARSTGPDDPARTPGPAMGPAPQPEVPGYVIEGVLGKGGMGVVYKARQISLNRLVALKMVLLGAGAGQRERWRFQIEAEAVAAMQHPNVVQVHEVGEANGCPYLAMEYVEGGSLAQLLERSRPTPRQAAELTATLAAAMAYAHGRGIVHRDLKPANVLLSEASRGRQSPESATPAEALPTPGADAPGSPLNVPKITDFGLAKRLDADQAATRSGDVMGTPAYMAPEQARGKSHLAGPACDVHALGVILYEMLAGQPPFRGESSVEVMFQVIDSVPPPPSRLRKGVPRDLDVICLKCLEKEPTRRYRSAAELADDLGRFLAGRPVSARPLGRTARAWRWARRNPTVAALAALLAAALLGGTGAASFFAVQASARADKAQEAADRAREERDAKDRALTDEQQARQFAFAALRSMTALVERKFVQGATLTEDDRAFLRGIIAQCDAFATIKGDDLESRTLRAEGRERVGNIRYRLGELREAEQAYDQAVSIRKQLVAEFPSHPELRHTLATSYNNRGLLLETLARTKQAEQDHDQALSIQKPLVAEFPSRAEFRELLAAIHNNRGNLLRDTDRLKEAERDYDEALSIRKQLVADFPTQVEFRHTLATTYGNRGSLRRVTNRLPEAKQDSDEALRIFKQLADEFPSRLEFRQNLAKSYSNRGNLLRAMKRLKEAEPDFDEALRIRLRLAADFPTRPELRQDLAGSYRNRSTLLSDVGRLPEAQKDGEAALSIERQLVVEFPDQPDLRNELGGSCLNLAHYRRQQRDWAGAKQLLLEGRPHHLAALKANSRNPTYREFYGKHLFVLTGVHAGLLEQADAVRTAETRRTLGWHPFYDAYDAACCLSLCIPFVAEHDKLDDKQRKEAVQFYGDAAMVLLREAVTKGFEDAAHVRQDTDLDPLRGRDDFKKLLAELEARKKGKAAKKDAEPK